MSELDAKLEKAAEKACGSKVRFEGFYPLVETFRGAVVWEGIVTQFESDIGRVYAWAVESDSGPQYVTVLQTPPVDSPLSAVRAWLVSQTKNQIR